MIRRDALHDPGDDFTCPALRLGGGLRLDLADLPGHILARRLFDRGQQFLASLLPAHLGDPL